MDSKTDILHLLRHVRVTFDKSRVAGAARKCDTIVIGNAIIDGFDFLREAKYWPAYQSLLKIVGQPACIS